jgi:hypothetical protein
VLNLAPGSQVVVQNLISYPKSTAKADPNDAAVVQVLSGAMKGKTYYTPAHHVTRLVEPRRAIVGGVSVAEVKIKPGERMIVGSPPRRLGLQSAVPIGREMADSTEFEAAQERGNESVMNGLLSRERVWKVQPRAAVLVLDVRESGLTTVAQVKFLADPHRGDIGWVMGSFLWPADAVTKTAPSRAPVMTLPRTSPKSPDR